MIGFGTNARRRRYREILSALSRHGLGVLINGAGIGRLLPLHRGLLGHTRRETPYTTAEHVRLAMEELGTTAIKLGQILSTRPDLIPPEYVAEFAKLQERVSPVAVDGIIAVVERELGSPVEELFAEFETQPLAVASIGQVHGAVLRDGTRVVVKVQKPGVAERVAEDLAILADLARRASGASFASFYDLEALVDDFAWTLRSELNYVREGRNADRLREILRGLAAIVVPEVHWGLTTGAVLVMERIDGTPIADRTALSRNGEPRALARAGVEALLTQVFEAGFFHADPHPGNFLVTPSGRLALLDFGMVGYLDDELRFRLLQLLDSAVRQDAGDAADALESLGVLRSSAARDSIRRDLQHLLDGYYGLSLDELDVSVFLSDLLAVVRRNRLQLPTELTLVLKTVAMSESLWRQLDPELNLALVAEPFVKRANSPRTALKLWRRRMADAGRQSTVAAVALPGQVSRIAARLDRGELEIALRHRDLDDALDRFSETIARLATAILASSFVIGLAIIGVAEDPPGWGLFAPVWFAGGVVAAAGLVIRFAMLGRRRTRR